MSGRGASGKRGRPSSDATVTPSSTALDETLAAFPRAAIDHDTLSWYEGLRAGELRINHCRRCGAWHNPPGPRCPGCWSGDVVAETVDGTGVVELVTVLHVGPAVDGIDYERGHPLVSVALDGVPGVRVTAPMIGVAPEAIQPDMRVEYDVVERNGTPTLVFRPTTPDGTA